MLSPVKEIVKRILFKPPHVKWCSQTVYQSLLGCIKLYEATGSEKWKLRASELRQILTAIQCEDGGFDIAYDFNFGMLHRKGESTSPELVGLLALVEYGRVFGFNRDLKESCDKAADWISRNVKWEGEACYVPYAPYSSHSVMVYNGTSFAVGALGYYLGVLQNEDLRLTAAYRGMVKYLDSVMLRSETIPSGRYWPYNDQNRIDIGLVKRNKVDYYHQMQQVEMHAYCHSVMPHELHTAMMEDAVDYVVEIFHQEGYLPYTNNSVDFKGLIHVWGLSSVLSGVLMCRKVTSANRAKWDGLLYFVIDFLLEKSWNGKFFFPILDKQGSPRSKIYMVRSDAWVFNSLSSVVLSGVLEQHKMEEIIVILEKCYCRMEDVNFSGPESHASTLRTRLFGRVASIF
jgi:hypothetical protein